MPRKRTFVAEPERVKVNDRWFGRGKPGPVEIYDVDGQYLKTCFHGDKGEKVTYVKAKGIKAYRWYCSVCNAIWYEVL